MAGTVAAVSDQPVRDPSVAVHRLRDRLAGRPADDVLRTEVSEILASKLYSWIGELRRIGLEDLKARAFDRLDIPTTRGVHALSNDETLDVIDQILVIAIPVINTSNTHDRQRYFANFGKHLQRLDELLEDARSLYVVDHEGDTLRLGTRVAPSIREVVTNLQGSGSANLHLQHAWAALHQLHPDAATAYKEAVKSLEAALGPLILPTDASPTLGQIRAALHSGSWQFALARTGPPGKAPSIAEAGTSSVVFLVDLLERVYGTEARHGESSGQRAQSLEEANGAVYAAVAVLGWTQTGTLSKEP